MNNSSLIGVGYTQSLRPGKHVKFIVYSAFLQYVNWAQFVNFPYAQNAHLPKRSIYEQSAAGFALSHNAMHFSEE